MNLDERNLVRLVKIRESEERHNGSLPICEGISHDRRCGLFSIAPETKIRTSGRQLNRDRSFHDCEIR